MIADEIMKELEPLGSDRYKRVLMNHGIREPFFGVKIEYLKKIQKRIKKDYQIALDLYDTGNYDAMYLAGLIADDSKMSKRDLQRWVKNAYCSALGEYTVAWVAAEGRFGHEMALEWIESKHDIVACAGWSTLCGLVALKQDSELDLGELKRLLLRVQQTIHKEPDAVRYTMNNFVIAVGTYVAPLTELALKAADKMGTVTVDMGNTECKVPSAAYYIKKVQQRGTIGKKKKSVKC